MRQHYSIARNADGEWVVRAEGRDLLLCARKSDALKAAKDANALSESPATRVPHASTKSRQMV